MKLLNRKLFTLMCTLVMLVALVACSQDTKENDAINEINNEQQSTNVDQAKDQAADEALSLYPLEVVDYTQTAITLTEEPKRVVTLVPSDTEIVFALNGGDQLVGVNGFSDYPEEALALEKIGDATINIEAVMALEPDLVLASYSMNGQYIDSIRQLGLTVYVAEPKTYDETILHIEQLGKLLNKQEEANTIAKDMKQVRETIEQKVAGQPKPNVYLEFSPGWTVGGNEYLDELITIAGGHNISSGQPGWYEVNSEAVIEANPDVIIYPNFGEEQSSILMAIQARPGWDVINAVKHNRLVEVANEPLVRVGPRLAIGLQDMAKAIHPELFK